MKKISKFTYLLIISSLLVITSCSKDDPKIPNEEELITTLKMTLTPVSGGNTVTLSFKDLDGDGGNSPVVTGGTLLRNSSYNGKLELLNESETPIDDITKEILAEADDHQFFFQSTVSGLSITYSDNDKNNKPLGLATLVKTVGAGSGKLTVTLRHKPSKNAQGVATGDITNAGGETDIAVTFDIVVQ